MVRRHRVSRRLTGHVVRSIRDDHAIGLPRRSRVPSGRFANRGMQFKSLSRAISHAMAFRQALADNQRTPSTVHHAMPERFAEPTHAVRRRTAPCVAGSGGIRVTSIVRLTTTPPDCADIAGPIP